MDPNYYKYSEQIEKINNDVNDLMSIDNIFTKIIEIVNQISNENDKLQIMTIVTELKDINTNTQTQLNELNSITNSSQIILDNDEIIKFHQSLIKLNIVIINNALKKFLNINIMNTGIKEKIDALINRLQQNNNQIATIIDTNVRVDNTISTEIDTNLAQMMNQRLGSLLQTSNQGAPRISRQSGVPLDQFNDSIGTISFSQGNTLTNLNNLDLMLFEKIKNSTAIPSLNGGSSLSTNTKILFITIIEKFKKLAFDIYYNNIFIKIMILMLDPVLYKRCIETIQIDHMGNMFKLFFIKVDNVMDNNIFINDINIDNDTKIYKAINNGVNDGVNDDKYIFAIRIVNNIWNIIQKNDHTIFLNTEKNLQYLKYFYDNIVKKIVYLNGINTILNTGDKSNIINNFYNDFIQKYNNIYTFIKERIDDNKQNPRYLIEQTIGENYATLKYINTNEDNSTIKSSNIPYNEQYTITPITKYYKFDEKNEAIINSNEFKDLIRKIYEKQSVIIFGYGQSGAGKTTTLFFKTGESGDKSIPGIIPLLCKKLSNIKLITIKTTEIIANINNQQDISNINIEKSTQPLYSCSNNGPFNFKKNSNGDWIMDTLNFMFKGMNIDEKYKNLQQFFLIPIEKNRDVNTTIYNSESSRSHVLVNIELTFNDNSKSNIVVCDLAGVEAEFTCSTSELLKLVENYKTKEITVPKEYKVDNTVVKYIKKKRTKYDASHNKTSELLQPMILEINNEYNNKPYDYIINDLVEKINTDNSALSTKKTEYIKLINTYFSYITLIIDWSLKSKDQTYKSWVENSKNDTLANFFKKLFKIPQKYHNTNFIKEIIPETDISNTFQLPQSDKDAMIKSYARRRIDQATKSNIPNVSESYKILDANFLDVKNVNKIENIIKLENEENIKKKEYVELLDAYNRLYLNCQKRKAEGKMINTSLSGMTQYIPSVIHKILDKKLENKLNGLPFFINTMGDNCIQNQRETYDFINVMKKLNNPISVSQSSPDNVIFTEIKKFINNFEDVNIVIFTIINLSEIANNPPTVPYINTNKLKLIYYCINYVFTILKTKVYQDNDIISSYNTILDNLLNNFKKYLDKFIINIKQYNFYKSMFLDTKSKINKHITDIKSNLYPNDVAIMLNVLKLFIQMIDGFNEITLIGTLDFQKFTQLKDPEQLFLTCDNNEIYDKIKLNTNNLLELNLTDEHGIFIDL